MNRIELIKKLEIVSGALSDLVPIFSCFLFDGDNVVAYNDALAISAQWPSEEQFAVNGKTFLGLLKNSKVDDVVFELRGDDLTMKAGRSVFKLPTMRKDEFIFEAPDCKDSVGWILDDKAVAGLAACLTTTSSDLAHPAFMGVRICAVKNEVFLYSCNGDAITKCRIGSALSLENDFDFMLPKAFCEIVLKVIKETGPVEKVLAFTKEWALAAFGNGFTCYGRMMEIDTPVDHEEMLNVTAKGAPVFVTIPPGLDNALSRARVLADEVSAKTSLTIKSGRLLLFTDTHMGEVRDSLACPKHPEVQAKISAEVIQPSLSLCTEMAVFENCTFFRKGDDLLQLVSNL